MKRTWLHSRGGWPVELIKGRPILNFVRILIHARQARLLGVRARKQQRCAKKAHNGPALRSAHGRSSTRMGLERNYGAKWFEFAKAE